MLRTKAGGFDHPVPQLATVANLFRINSVQVFPALVPQEKVLFLAI